MRHLCGICPLHQVLGYQSQSMASAAMENAPAKGETPKKSFFLPCSQQRLFGLVEDWNEAVFGEKAVRKTALTWSKSPFLDKPFPMIAAHVLRWLGRRVLRQRLWLVYRQP